MSAPEYGRAGVYGVLTPQGNPTVEPELRVLLPDGAAMLVSRLISPVPALKDRLIAYITDIGQTLEAFDGLAFDAVGFACTGSSYLVTPDEERRLLDAAEARFGYPVITAARAIELALDTLGVKRLALISPYPAWLTEASQAHWTRAGYSVDTVIAVPTGGTPGQHGIYGVTTPAVLKAAEAIDVSRADAVLITGTGMPSLRSILALEPRLNLPILSSNLCLAWALARVRGMASAGEESRIHGGWAARLALA